MPNIVKTLADGQLPTTKAALFTASFSTFLTIILSHTGAVDRTVNLYLKRSASTSRRIIPKDMTMNAGDTAYVDIDGTPLYLAIGDAIEGSAAAAAEIDYTITGSERK